MTDFLTFKTFISGHVLIIFYYLGAVGMPLAGYLVFRWMVRKLAEQHIEPGHIATGAWSRLPSRYRLVTILVVIGAFLFMQLLWRMLFEFLIAYLQIRDALVNP
jgi:hypothetical protein